MDTPICRVFVEFAEKVCPGFKFTGRVTECIEPCNSDCIILAFRNVEKLVEKKED